VDLLRGQIAFALRRGSEAPPLLLSAAKRFESLDVAAARETYWSCLQRPYSRGPSQRAGAWWRQLGRRALDPQPLRRRVLVIYSSTAWPC
jgi:hypothetical protein